MAENSKIEWTHHTFNPWEGCSKVSPGCAHCYAEARAKRFGTVKWGPEGTRRIAAEPYWRQPLKWDLEAARAGERRRVFCASLADVFEDRPELVAPRERLFYLIGDTPNLDWLLLTKRPEAASTAIPYHAGRVASRYMDQGLHMEAAAIHQDFCLPNVWLGVSVENRQHGLPRIDILRTIPAAVRFLSVEPLLEDLGQIDLRAIGWAIIGGESGPGARPFLIDWARDIIDQCAAADVPCFVKQLGTRPRALTGTGVAEVIVLKDRKGGDMKEWRADLRVREFPKKVLQL